jgi:hypothetical protein
LRQKNVSHVKYKKTFVCGKKNIGHNNFRVKSAGQSFSDFISEPIGKITPINIFV